MTRPVCRRRQPQIADLGHELVGHGVRRLPADLELLGCARRAVVGPERLVDRAAQAGVELNLTRRHGEILDHHDLRPRQFGAAGLELT